MIRKYRNHTPQTNKRHHEEEQQNTDCHKTSGRQLKQKKPSSLFPIKVIAKLDEHKALKNKTRTKHRIPTNNGSNNKQKINNNRTIAVERTAAHATEGGGGGGGLIVFHWYQIFAQPWITFPAQIVICLQLIYMFSIVLFLVSSLGNDMHLADK